MWQQFNFKIFVCSLFQCLTLDVIGRCAFGLRTNAQADDKDPFLINVRSLFSRLSKTMILPAVSKYIFLTGAIETPFSLFTFYEWSYSSNHSIQILLFQCSFLSCNILCLQWRILLYCLVWTQLCGSEWKWKKSSKSEGKWG